MDFTKILQMLPEGLRQTAIDLEQEGALDTGAHYAWPRESGGYLDVIGGGLIFSKNKPVLVGCHMSKKTNGAKITLLELDLPLRMIAQGEVKYLGNIMNPEYRKTIDMEKMSLAIMGLISTIYTVKQQKRVSVEEILDKVERGEMSLSELMQKAGIPQDLAPEEYTNQSNIIMPEGLCNIQ
jgi:hypothetical protein